jgi:HAD superfamily hydrolase (TIGR01493 family)
VQPGPGIYRKAMDLMQLDPKECVMVAAHAYDLRAAKKKSASVFSERGFRTSD